MDVKLSFNRLLYGCLFEVSQNGGTCIDPISFHFPLLTDAYQSEEKEFIFANAIKVSPALETGQ